MVVDEDRKQVLTEHQDADLLDRLRPGGVLRTTGAPAAAP